MSLTKLARQKNRCNSSHVTWVSLCVRDYGTRHVYSWNNKSCVLLISFFLPPGEVSDSENVETWSPAKPPSSWRLGLHRATGATKLSSLWGSEGWHIYMRVCIKTAAADFLFFLAFFTTLYQLRNYILLNKIIWLVFWHISSNSSVICLEVLSNATKSLRLTDQQRGFVQITSRIQSRNCMDKHSKILYRNFSFICTHDNGVI